MVCRAALRSVSLPPSPNISMSSGVIARTIGNYRPRSAIGTPSALTLPRKFGPMRFDILCRSDIIRWRDDCAEGKQAKFNRALPVLAAMLKYAEALGYLRKGSNPCRGTPRFKRKAMERFFSPLGAVCIQRNQIMAHARWTKPMNAVMVFSHLRAILRKRLSLLKKHST